MDSTTRHLLLLLLAAGCSHRASEVTPRMPAVASQQRLSDARTALGLGPTLSLEQVVALEQRCRSEGRFAGHACGESTFDGIGYGAYSNRYRLTVPELGETFLSFRHIQHGDHPPIALSGRGFSYRRQGDVFILKPPTGDAN